jgi:hypothetical protein
MALVGQAEKVGNGTGSLRVREEIGMSAGLADESVCPTLTHKDLRMSGAGAFACEPIFSRILAAAVGFSY